MLTSIVKATRAHYAALQHRASSDRTPLYFYAVNENAAWRLLTAGTLHVKIGRKGAGKRELTKLINRLQMMYPEATEIEASYKKPFDVRELP
jgi:hypothetical protein